VSAILIKGKGYQVWGNLANKVKFSASQVTVRVEGVLKVKFYDTGLEVSIE
jgi:hypothetical protein